MLNQPFSRRIVSNNTDLQLKTTVLGGVTLTLSPADKSHPEWIGQTEILKQLLACWLVIAEKDFPLSPRIVGMPGIGKTTQKS